MTLQESIWLQRLDPRLRIVAAVLLCIATAFSMDIPSAGMGLAIAGLLALVLRTPLRTLAWVLFRLNGIFLLMAFMTLPFVPGTELTRVGPALITEEGVRLMLLIVLKGNALVLFCAVLLSTMEAATLGHALSRLGLPVTLVRLFMCTIRYVDVLQDEFVRMRMAMRARGFQSRLNTLTLRAHAQLVGSLLLRSLERSERVAAAMKCRGHHGVYAATSTLVWRRSDSIALFAVTGLSLALLGTGWVW